MNSFRVMDTKFRILKGGKIGLACSIALIGAMLILGSTKAYSQTYFNGVTDGTTYTSGDISATAKTDTGSSSVTYNFVSSSEDIFFNPERVLSSYKGVMDYEVTGSSPNQSVILSGSSGTNNGTLINNIADGTYTYTTLDSNLDPIIGTEDNYDKAYYESFTPSTIFTVRLTSGAEAKNINKNASLYYSVDSATGYNITNNPYTANLIFDGSNIIHGNTNIGNGNIQLNGGVVFKGTVATGSIDVNAGITTFEDTVTATTTTITGGTVILNSNLTGNVVTIGNQGILTTTGVTQTITGDIGSGTSSLDTLNIGSDTVPGNYSKTTIKGNVFATNTILNNNNNDNSDGTTNSSELILSSGKNITSIITTADADMGILTLAGGTQTVSGTVGEDGISLKEINAGAAGSTSTFTEDVYALNTNIGSGTVILNSNLTGNVVTTGNQGILTATGATQTITGDIVSGTSSLNTLNIGSDTVSGNYSKTTINGNVFATNTILNNNNNDNIDGTTNSSELILSSGKNITSTITTADADMGILTLAGGTQTVSGTVGEDGISLKEINAGVNGGTVTFDDMVYASTLKYSDDGKVVLNGDNSSNTSSEGMIGTVNFDNKAGTLAIGDDVNLTVGAGGTQFINGNNAILEFAGSSIITGILGGNTAGNSTFKRINAGATAETVTFRNDVYAINLNVNSGTVNLDGNFIGTEIKYNADGTVVLADGQNINSVITTATNNTGRLILEGSSTVTGQVGTGGVSGASLAEVNVSGADDSMSTFESDVYVTNLNIVSGTVSFEDNVVATTTTIDSGTANFNTTGGTTTTDIVFAGNGTANLNNGLDGDIKFAGNDGIVNVADGKGILGSIETLANNTGIVNFKGDGTISNSIGNKIGSDIYGIKELNINTSNKQNNSTDGVLVTYDDALGRELYADVVSLRNNATLTLADGVDIINTGSDNIIITVGATDATNTGTLTFQGTSNIEGEVGQSNKVLNTINAGATGKTVTFDDMVYASTLKYSDDGKVVLNGDNSSNTSSEGMIGTVNFDNKAGTLAIGDDVNLTVGAGGTQFINGNDAILEFAGSSIITGILGGNTAGNSTFKRINAGATAETVTFRNDVYVKESTFHVNGTGTVNFQGNLIGSLIYDADGVVNVSDGKNIVVSSAPVAVTTATTDTGSLNFLGTTLLATDIGTSTERLKNVTFGSSGSASNTYTQNLTKDIYARNTYIGNGTNQTILEMNDDIIFGGSLIVRANSALDVNTHDITVTQNLALAANSLTGFKIYTSDITSSGSSTGVPSGSITTDTLTIDDNAIIKVNYVGTLYGAGSYNLISANSITGTYYGTEANGKVSDNSIIDSIIKVDGNNLILFADRTGGGSYAVEDLYIKKSEIGQHYSNGASEALAGYAYDTIVREGALGEVITKMEELDGGLYLTSEKKAQMVEMQKLLTPVANNSSIQSSITASNLVLSTIKDRMADMRVSSSTDFIPYGYSGYSSGTYTLNNSFWVKAMGSKATQSKVQDYDGYESTTVGFVAGLDRTLRSGATIGLAVAQANTKIDQTDFRSGDSSDTQSIQFSTYGSKEIGDTYVDGVLSYAKHSTDSTRRANSGKLTSSSDAEQISAKVEVGHRVYFEDLATLTPFASLEYGNLNQKGYTEKGTAYQNDALKVDSVKMNKGTLGVGAKLTTNLNVGNNVVIPEFKLAAYNAIGDSNADIKAQYTGGGNQFVTPTQELNKTIYNAGLGVKTTLGESTSLMLGVDYDRSKDGNFEGYSGNVSFRLSF